MTGPIKVFQIETEVNGTDCLNSPLRLRGAGGVTPKYRNFHNHLMEVVRIVALNVQW